MGTLPEGQKITICEGDLKDQRPNVIVHPTNAYFQLDGELGVEIKRINGAALQEEMERLRVEQKSIPALGAVVQSGLNIGTTQVIHVNVLDHLRKDKEKCLPTAIQNILELAQRQKFESVVFPDMGCGKIPVQAAAEVVMTSLVTYFSSLGKESCVRDVLVVFPDLRDVNVYVACLQGMDNVETRIVEDNDEDEASTHDDKASTHDDEASTHEDEASFLDFLI